jgi:hypothetical protein
VGSVAHNNYIFSIGGQVSDTSGALQEVWRYDGVSWQKMTDLPVPVGNVTDQIYSWNNKLFVLGGGLYRVKPLERTFGSQIFYSENNGESWINGGKFPGVGRFYSHIKKFDNCLVLIGGSGRYDFSNFPDVVSNNLPEFWYSRDGLKWYHQPIKNLPGSHAISLAKYGNNLIWASGNHQVGIEPNPTFSIHFSKNKKEIPNALLPDSIRFETVQYLKNYPETTKLIIPEEFESDKFHLKAVKYSFDFNPDFDNPTGVQIRISKKKEKKLLYFAGLECKNSPESFSQVVFSPPISVSKGDILDLNIPEIHKKQFGGTVTTTYFFSKK